MKIGNYIFVKTSDACPEQYSVYKDEKQVAYVRLRFGTLECESQEVGGKYIYKKEFENRWKGCFTNRTERLKYLRLISNVLDKKFNISEEVHNFSWAIKQINNGKKVVRKLFKEYWYCYKTKSKFSNNNVIMARILKETSSGQKVGKDYSLSAIHHLLATDWEIYNDNSFGDFEVLKDGNIRINKKHPTIMKDIDNLEKAIKKARSLKWKN